MSKQEGIGSPVGYSRLQVTLHWLVVILVIFQFLAHEGMEHVWDAYERGRGTEAGDVALAYAHVAAGATIMILALLRLWLRMTVGAPDLPGHSAIIRYVAHATHWALYALLIATPATGATAWFFGVDDAADIHEALKTALLLVVVLHVAGALVEHFVMRTDVLKRMLVPARR